MKQIFTKANTENLVSVAKGLPILILLFALVCFINTYVIRLAIVSGESMYPTFADRDILLISQLNYKPSQDDVVLIDISESPVPGQYIIKRVIAIEGDTVRLDYESNSVFVNGVKLSEPYLNFEQSDPMIALDATNDVTYQVSTGTVFVMGDNRNNSIASRNDMLGMIKKEDIVGKVCSHLSLQQFFS